MRELLITEFAKQSLSDNLIFLAQQGASLEVIIQLHEKILSRIEQLCSSPFLGQGEELIDGGLHRRLVEGNYKIIYIVTDHNIIVTDVFDARQDPKKLIRGVDL